MKKIVLIIMILFAFVAISTVSYSVYAAEKRGGKAVMIEGLVIKSKVWRPDAMETFSWKKERMRADRLKKNESFLPRIKESVKKDPF